MIRYRDTKDLETLFQCASLLRLRRYFTRRESLELARTYLGGNSRSHSSDLQRLKNHFTGDAGTGLRWPSRTISYYFDTSRFGDLKIADNPTVSDIKSLHQAQYDKYSAIANVNFVEEFNPANADLKTRFDDVDGEGGVLAYVTQPAAGEDMSVIRNEYVIDAAHTCSMDDMGNIFLHEDGHVLGLDHGPFYSIMRPFYMFGTPLQELDRWTIQETIQRYGIRRIAA